MNDPKLIAGILLAAACVSIWPFARGEDTNSVACSKPRPDLLTTCPVSGEKLGEMGMPYVFIYLGQEVKLCCSSCTNDFYKSPAKYMQKIQAADKANR